MVADSFDELWDGADAMQGLSHQENVLTRTCRARVLKRSSGQARSSSTICRELYVGLYANSTFRFFSLYVTSTSTLHAFLRDLYVNSTRLFTLPLRELYAYALHQLYVWFTLAQKYIFFALYQLYMTFTPTLRQLYANFP